MNALQAGITAAREGRRAEARALLHQALQVNPRSEQGWLWMSAVVETDAERRICLERVLAINPHNQTARVGLDRLKTEERPKPDSSQGYLPVARSAVPRNEARAKVAAPSAAAQPAPTLPRPQPPSPHTMPTLGMAPVTSGLPPVSDPMDGLARLRAARLRSQPSSAPAPSSQPVSFVALVLIAGLSVTAIAGALMLALLWLIGWPP